MSEQIKDEVGSALQKLTQWPSDAPDRGLWRESLRRAELAGPRKQSAIADAFRGLLTGSPWRLAAASAGLLLIGAIAWTIMEPSRAHDTARVALRQDMANAPRSTTPPQRALIGVDGADRSLTIVGDDYSGDNISGGFGGGADGRDYSFIRGQSHFFPSLARAAEGNFVNIDGLLRSDAENISTAMTSSSPQHTLFNARNPGNAHQTLADEDSMDRQIIRKAMIELETDDVRAAFLRAMQLVSAAGGEYVQDSAITGQDERTQAHLTLHIATARLSEVLNGLRNLGIVRNEQIGGEDVTAQIVDLNARLRNEQRVEQEMLELLESRSDSPLKEILELREHLSRVRQQIESLTARQQQLARLVDLATILVIIRPPAKDAPEPEHPKVQSLGEHFRESLGESWTGGVRFLADTIAGLVAILVGGLVWWLIGIVAIIALRRRLQSRAATPAASTTPAA